jgi:UDPglucose--hexose-1-phosphate uridylyltransferase
MVNPPESTPRTLLDPTTGRPILMAPQRQQRPMHTGGQAHGKRCPFCQGHEQDTPPEIGAIRDPGTAADGPGWVARAFPNKYPANLHHEVFAEGREHHEQPADLDVATWRAVIALWRERIVALEATPGLHCAFLFKNVGAAAGASIEHNHSQVLGLPELPPRLTLELQAARTLDHCPWCRTMASAAGDGRLVFASRHHTVLSPEPPKLPHETWLLPNRCDDDFLTTDVDSLATALHALFAAVGRGLGRPAFNLWLHRVPGERFHWHFELQPRTGQMAGLELGGDMYINSLPAAVSAAKLRAGLAANTSAGR